MIINNNLSGMFEYKHVFQDAIKKFELNPRSVWDKVRLEGSQITKKYQNSMESEQKQVSDTIHNFCLIISNHYILWIECD